MFHLEYSNRIVLQRTVLEIPCDVRHFPGKTGIIILLEIRLFIFIAKIRENILTILKK